jgi:hypothetical protein
VKIVGGGRCEKRFHKIVMNTSIFQFPAERPPKVPPAPLFPTLLLCYEMHDDDDDDDVRFVFSCTGGRHARAASQPSSRWETSYEAACNQVLNAPSWLKDFLAQPYPKALR